MGGEGAIPAAPALSIWRPASALAVQSPRCQRAQVAAALPCQPSVHVVDSNQPTSRARRFLFPLLSMLLSIIVCLASAEMLLRFLPVQSGLRTMPVTADNPVFHFL